MRNRRLLNFTNNLKISGGKGVRRGAMTIFELMKSDEVFTRESNAILYRMSFVFLALYYGLSSLAIYTAIGRQAVEYLATLLPSILKYQYDLLRGIDGSSHASYLLMFPTVLGVGAYYFYRKALNVRAFFQRNLQYGESCAKPYRQSVVAICASIFILLALIFSGTITMPDEGVRTRPWLIWPVSGVSSLGSLLVFLMGANMYLVARIFRSKRNAGN